MHAAIEPVRAVSKVTSRKYGSPVLNTYTETFSLFIGM